MRLHRFYHSEKIGDKKELTISSADFANQISRVFRLSVGDKVVVFDGSGNDYICELLEARPRGPIVLRICEVGPSRFMPTRKIYLFQSMIKKDKFEWVVEKTTELGVTDIVPVLAEHSEKKSLNFERLNKIATEASEQCGRGDVPVVHGVMTRLSGLSEYNFRKIVMDLNGEVATARSGLALTSSLETIGVFIGPEGGWSPSELEMFHKNGITVCSLGKQVLRAETAAIATLSLVVF
jgi:16S rRNA (uracil1498-N3)-methyltransferase